VFWCCWLGGRKPVKNWVVGCCISVWREVQTCVWPSWCHCHSLSLASVKSRLVFPFWYRLTHVVPDKGLSNGCMYVCWVNVSYVISVLFCRKRTTAVSSKCHLQSFSASAVTWVRLENLSLFAAQKKVSSSQLVAISEQVSLALLWLMIYVVSSAVHIVCVSSLYAVCTSTRMTTFTTAFSPF